MKKTLSILLATIILTLSFAGCGENSTKTDKSNKTTTNTSSVCWDKLGNANEGTYEVVSTYSKVFSVHFGYAYISTFIEIKNKTDYKMEILPMVHYSLSAADGAKIVEDGMVDRLSDSVIYPHKTVYCYRMDQIKNDSLKEGDILNCEVGDLSGKLSVYHDEIQPENNYVYQNVSDISSITADDDQNTNLQIKGKVKSELDGDIYLYAVGFDKSKKPICFFSGSVENAKKGESYEFSIIAPNYNYYKPEDVKNISDIKAIAIK